MKIRLRKSKTITRCKARPALLYVQLCHHRALRNFKRDWQHEIPLSPIRYPVVQREIVSCPSTPTMKAVCGVTLTTNCRRIKITAGKSCTTASAEIGLYSNISLPTHPYKPCDQLKLGGKKYQFLCTIASPTRRYPPFASNWPQLLPPSQPIPSAAAAATMSRSPLIMSGWTVGCACVDVGWIATK